MDVARAKQRRHDATTADIERAGKPVRGIVQPIDQAPGCLTENVARPLHGCRCPFPMQPHRPAVEDKHFVHGWQMRARRQKRKRFFFEKKNQKTFASLG
jgi:hypothetical protein